MVIDSLALSMNRLGDMALPDLLVSLGARDERKQVDVAI